MRQTEHCEEARMEIAEVLSIEGKRAQIIAKHAPFHPSGGGQPGDTGYLCGIGGDAFRAEVRDARKHKESGGILLDLRLIEGQPQPGAEVSATVDVERNRILSRMHTAQHIFSRIQENVCEGLETQKVNIGTEESAVYMHYEGGSPGRGCSTWRSGRWRPYVRICLSSRSSRTGRRRSEFPS